MSQITQIGLKKLVYPNFLIKTHIVISKNQVVLIQRLKIRKSSKKLYLNIPY